METSKGGLYQRILDIQLKNGEITQVEYDKQMGKLPKPDADPTPPQPPPAVEAPVVRLAKAGQLPPKITS